MSLLDNLNGLLGAHKNEVGNTSGLMALLPQLLEQMGGVQGLLARFEQNGLGNVVQSWISSGQNLPISADQITKILGNDTLGHLAKSTGLDTNATAGRLAEALPQAIDALTPDGKISDNLLAQGMDILQNLKRGLG